jgi:hypothetical protein
MDEFSVFETSESPQFLFTSPFRYLGGSQTPYALFAEFYVGFFYDFAHLENLQGS